MVVEVLVAATALFQTTSTVPKNPTGVAFLCPDHDQDTGHEVDIVRVDGVVVQTLDLGDALPVNAQGEVEATLNVQPVAFGAYTFVVRATAGTVESADSEPSAVWERVPGAPTKVRVK